VRRLILLAVIWAQPLLAATPGVTLATAPSMVKIRPTLPLPPSAKAGAPIALTAARGECEGAQVVVSAGAAGVQHLELSVSPLRAGARELSALLYREAFLDVRTPSDIEGATGLWPDPLIPVVDEIAHERRNAFPVDVPAGRHQPVYVEVCVPHATAPGVYTGEVTATATGLAPTKLPISIDVQAVEIPATSSLPVTFGLSGKSLMYGHYGEKLDDDVRLTLVHRYALAALRHRISLYSMSMRPPKVDASTDDVRVDFHDWDAEIGPFMDGQVGLDGARFSAIDLRTPSELKGPALTSYYRAVESHFREKGWLDRLFAYVMDEPKPKQRDELVRRLEALAPVHGIRRLVTTPLEPALTGKIDIWTPNLNCLEYKKKPHEFCGTLTPRESYDARIARGEKLWWYQSCSSHGCKGGPFGTAVDQYFTGWPSYMVDVDGAAARIMGWLEFGHGIGGELYFDTVYGYNLFEKSRPQRQDPWDSVWAFGGNGDGTLFYPGRPDRIGGKTDVPIESLRLKLIRDGLEDYELLKLLAATGKDGAKQAQEIALKLAPRLFQYERSPEAFAAARTAIFEALKKSGKVSSAQPGPRPE
jgi:hypothetical protein